MAYPRETLVTVEVQYLGERSESPGQASFQEQRQREAQKARDFVARALVAHGQAGKPGCFVETWRIVGPIEGAMIDTSPALPGRWLCPCGWKGEGADIRHAAAMLSCPGCGGDPRAMRFERKMGAGPDPASFVGFVDVDCRGCGRRSAFSVEPAPEFWGHERGDEYPQPGTTEKRALLELCPLCCAARDLPACECPVCRRWAPRLDPASAKALYRSYGPRPNARPIYACGGCRFIFEWPKPAKRLDWLPLFEPSAVGFTPTGQPIGFRAFVTPLGLTLEVRQRNRIAAPPFWAWHLDGEDVAVSLGILLQPTALAGGPFRRPSQARRAAEDWLRESLREGLAGGITSEVVLAAVRETLALLGEGS